MSRAEQLVIDAARQLVAAYRPELDYVTLDLNTRLMNLSLAVRALDRAETVRPRDADLGDQCRCPDHRYD